MGYQDKNLMFSDGQSIAAEAGTLLSDKSLPIGSASAKHNGDYPLRDLGRGEELHVVAQITEAVVGSGASVQAKLVYADNAALTTNVVVVNETIAIEVASLVAGYQFRLGTVPAGIPSGKHLGLQYVVSGATTTAGKVTAYLSKDRQTNLASL